jgi:hypothetical protein
MRPRLPVFTLFGPHGMSDLSPEWTPKRTSADHSEFMRSRLGQHRCCGLIRPTGNSHMTAMRKLPVVLICRTAAALPKTPSTSHSQRPVLDKGRFAVVTNVEAGFGGRFSGAGRATF